jgi:FtsP/CotA-like multicopper oxidase with cupredoxin domain
MTITRRLLLTYAALAPAVSALSALGQAKQAVAPDYTLRIASGLVELWRRRTSSRPALYNGQFPGPLLRLQEGQPRHRGRPQRHRYTPELVHWHGQMIPSEVDGAAEEGSPFIAARGMRRIAFVPQASGLPLLPHACYRPAAI